MTDLLNKTTTYYSGFQYNSTEDSVDCYINNQLLYPLVQKADDYQIALSKMKINLSSIPIGGQNTNIIPLKSWEVTINETVNGQLLSGSAFVRQINAKLGNFLFDASNQADAQLKQFSYNNITGTTSLIKTLTLIPFIVQMFVDDYGNIYCSCAHNLNGNANKFRVFDTEGQLLITTDYDVIKCIAIDINQTVFIATDTKVDVYTNVNSLDNVDLTLSSSITTNFAGNPLTNIVTVASDGLIIIGYNQNDITLYNDGLTPQADYNEPLISQIGKASQIISSARRFCLTDDNIIAESFVGIPLGGTSTVNMVDNTIWVSGSWSGLSKMALIVDQQNTQGVGYGIGDGDLATYKFQPCLPPTGTPSNINVQQNANCVELNGHLIANGYNTTQNTLFGLGLDNLNANTYFQFQSDFSPNVGVVAPLNFDIQNNNSKVIYCGSDNNLYRSSAGIYPKQCLIDGISVGNNTTFYAMGSSWNTDSAMLTQNATYLTTAVNNVGGALENWGAYKSTANNDCYLLSSMLEGASPVPPNAIYITKFNTTTYTVSDYGIISAQGASAPYTNLQLAQLGSGYYCMIGDFQTGDQIFIFEEALTAGNVTLVTSFILPVRIAYNAPIQARCIGYGNYLAIVSLTQIFTYDVSNPFAPILIANINNPIGSTLNQYSITACNNVIYTVSQSAVSAGEYAVCKLIPNGSWSAITSSLELEQYGITAFDPSLQRNSLSANETLDEISFLILNNFMEVYNGTGNVLTSQITIPSQANTSIGNFFYVFQDINKTYDLNLITTDPPATAIDCVACSKSSPNTIYVIQTADKLVYKSVYNPATNTLGNITVDVNISGTWGTINTILNSVDNALVYNFSTTDQSAQGQYVAGNKVLSIARNAVTNEFLVSKSNAPNNLVSLNANNFTQNFQTTLQVGSMWSKNSDDLDTGPFPVYTYEPIIAAINVAFLEAYARLQNLGGTYLTAPQISYDYNQGYLTLTYPALLTEINQGNSLVFSESLLQYVYFNNLNGTLILPLNSQSLTQTVRSLMLLNTLNALVLVSDTIFVSNSFQGNNIQNRNIATIDIPIDTFYAGNYGQILYFQPSFYRPYRLSSNGPIVNLTFRLNYETQDGNQYIVQLPPHSSWTFITAFVKKD